MSIIPRSSLGVALAALAIVLSVCALVGQEKATTPTLTERDQLVLTVLRLEVMNADLRLQKAISDLRKPGYRLDYIAGQWRYLEADEK